MTAKQNNKNQSAMEANHTSYMTNRWTTICKYYRHIATQSPIIYAHIGPHQSVPTTAIIL